MSNPSRTRNAALGTVAAGLLVAGPVALAMPAFADDHGGDHAEHHAEHHAEGHEHHGGEDHRHGRDDRRASSSRDAVQASGSCTGTSTWTLKAKPDDGGIEVEGQVDSNVVGQTWSWRFLDDNVLVARGRAVTTGPSGSFSVERHIADRPGTDQIRFRAGFGDEVCVGVVRL